MRRGEEECAVHICAHKKGISKNEKGLNAHIKMKDKMVDV